MDFNTKVWFTRTRNVKMPNRANKHDAGTDFFVPYYNQEFLVDLIKKNTRHFAKRQITWYKRMPYIEWIYIDCNTSKDFIFNIAMDLIRREGLA